MARSTWQLIHGGQNLSRLSPLIVVVGPTASGKSDLAMKLATQFNGELICADSRTIYKGMDIGTAKPSQHDRQAVPHFGLDLCTPDKPYSAAEFKKLAQNAIEDISGRGKLPIMVGGTGLYVDAVLYDFEFLPPSDPSVRSRLSVLSVDDLQTEILEKDLPLPINESNPRHLIRVIETGGASAKNKSLRHNTLVIGLDPGSEALKERIQQRITAMLIAGFTEEVSRLRHDYDWDAPGMLGTGYKAFREYIDGSQTIEQACTQFARNDYQLARRQRTWFKRNKSIQWIHDPRDAVAIVTTFLNKKQ